MHDETTASGGGDTEARTDAAQREDAPSFWHEPDPDRERVGGPPRALILAVALVSVLVLALAVSALVLSRSRTVTVTRPQPSSSSPSTTSTSPSTSSTSDHPSTASTSGGSQDAHPSTTPSAQGSQQPQAPAVPAPAQTQQPSTSIDSPTSSTHPPTSPAPTREGLTPFPSSTWDQCGAANDRRAVTAEQVRQTRGYNSSCDFLTSVRDAAQSHVARNPSSSAFDLNVYSAYRKQTIEGSDGWILLSCSRSGGLVHCSTGYPPVSIWVQEGSG